MIRFRSGRIPTTQELRDGLKGRVAITDFPIRKPKERRAPRTNIILCAICRKFYRLYRHDPHTCARQHGFTGHDRALRARALRGVA